MSTGWVLPGHGLSLWILAVVLVVAGIFAVLRSQVLWGIVLIVVGLLVGPGGVIVLSGTTLVVVAGPRARWATEGHLGSDLMRRAEGWPGTHAERPADGALRDPGGPGRGPMPHGSGRPQRG